MSISVVNETETETSTDRATQLISSSCPVVQRPIRAATHKDENQRLRRSMNSKKLASPKPLTPTDGNRRKSSRVKPSDKAKENNAQQEEGIIVHEDGNISVADASEAMDTADEGQGEDITPLMSNDRPVHIANSSKTAAAFCPMKRCQVRGKEAKKKSVKKEKQSS